MDFVDQIIVKGAVVISLFALIFIAYEFGGWLKRLWNDGTWIFRSIAFFLPSACSIAIIAYGCVTSRVLFFAFINALFLLMIFVFLRNAKNFLEKSHRFRRLYSILFRSVLTNGKFVPQVYEDEQSKPDNL